MRVRRHASFVLLTGLALAWTSASRADDKSACLDASSQAQTLRDSHHLLEARDQLRVCARAVCPAVIQKDCAAWLDTVEQGLPTVVIAAKDGNGRDLFDVKVSVDGKPLTSKLDGEAQPLDPGPHTFHFEFAAGTAPIDQQVLVREGVKNQAVSVALPGASPPPAPVAAPVAPAAESTNVAPATTPSSAGPWKTVGWIAAGAGVIGLGVGTIFGITAMSDKNSAQCSNDLCNASSLNDARNAASVSTVGFVAGGVLLAGGLAFVLLSPSTGASASVARLAVAPAVGPRDAGMSLGGSF